MGVALLAIQLTPLAKPSISPRTWGYSNATCLTGTLIGGGFKTDYPVEVGDSGPGNTNTWHLAAYNPYNGETSFTNANAVCAEIIP